MLAVVRPKMVAALPSPDERTQPAEVAEAPSSAPPAGAAGEGATNVYSSSSTDLAAAPGSEICPLGSGDPIPPDGGCAGLLDPAPPTPQAHLPGPPDPGPLSAQALAADIAYLASRPRGGRAPPEPLRAWLVSRLEAMGYAVTTQAVASDTGRNIVGMAVGRGRPEHSVMISAHFDSVPDSPGADDNASGVAAVLGVAAAQVVSEAPKSLLVALWDLEEQGRLGSAAWAAQARRLNVTIDHSLVLESVGYRDPRPLTQQLPWSLALAYPKVAWKIFTGGRRGDFVAAVGNQPDVLSRLAEQAAADDLSLHSLHVPNWLHPIARFTDLWSSDHASFWSEGYAATMLTDTAFLRNPNHHAPTDLPATLDLDYLAHVARLANAQVDFLRAGAPSAPP